MGVPDRLLDQLKHPAVAAVAVSWAKKLGKETEQLRSGKIDRSEFKRRARAHLAELTGATLGAAVGTLVGSLIPGVGTLVGAFAGGFLGEMTGAHLGDLAGRAPVKDGEPTEPKVPENMKRTL